MALCIEHILPIHSSTDGHLGCFHFRAAYLFTFLMKTFKWQDYFPYNVCYLFLYCWFIWCMERSILSTFLGLNFWITFTVYDISVLFKMWGWLIPYRDNILYFSATFNLLLFVHIHFFFVSCHITLWTLREPNMFVHHTKNMNELLRLDL